MSATPHIDAITCPNSAAWYAALEKERARSEAEYAYWYRVERGHLSLAEFRRRRYLARQGYNQQQIDQLIAQPRSKQNEKPH